jgi:hypothetical protein
MAVSLRQLFYDGWGRITQDNQGPNEVDVQLDLFTRNYSNNPDFLMDVFFNILTGAVNVTESSGIFFIVKDTNDNEYTSNIFAADYIEGENSHYSRSDMSVVFPDPEVDTFLKSISIYYSINGEISESSRIEISESFAFRDSDLAEDDGQGNMGIKVVGGNGDVTVRSDFRFVIEK